jgi:hypothetical protein
MSAGWSCGQAFRFRKLKMVALAEWCKDIVKLDHAPKVPIVGSWLKFESKTDSLRKLSTETSAHSLQKTSRYPVRYEEIEVRFIQWFHDIENHEQILTNEMLHENTLKIASSLNVQNFKARNGWINNVKRRAQIKQIVCHGESTSADIVDDRKQQMNANLPVDVAISQEASGCSLLFEHSLADDVYNADETGLFWKALPNRTLENKRKSGQKLQKDRMTLMLCYMRQALAN